MNIHADRDSSLRTEACCKTKRCGSSIEDCTVHCFDHTHHSSRSDWCMLQAEGSAQEGVGAGSRGGEWEQHRGQQGQSAQEGCAPL